MRGRNVLPMWFQSTHSLRSATNVDNATTWTLYVSIHALLAECDKWAFGLVSAVCCFNPRTPCGVRPRWQIWTWCTCGFQSTHSLRSATKRQRKPGMGILRFNPRTPCGVRQASQITSSFCTRFQSTHSLRSATGESRYPIARLLVSIHALLAECDRGPSLLYIVCRGFNPRTPCGVRH